MYFTPRTTLCAATAASKNIARGEYRCCSRVMWSSCQAERERDGENSANDWNVETICPRSHRHAGCGARPRQSERRFFSSGVV